MLMQRQYQDGRVTHVLVKHTGSSPEQNFSHRLVERAIAEGWMRIAGAQLVVRAQPSDLVYAIKREPGYYCKSTGERIPISAMAWVRMRTTGQGDISAAEARAWLQAQGKAPNDYEVTQAYECVLSQEQHDTFRAVTDAKGRIVGAHTMEG